MQNFPTTAQAIYDVLAADTTFTNLLGSYEFRAGQQTTAISIVSAGEDLPALRNVSGVECIVQDAGNFTSNEYLTGDAPRLTVQWSVFLVAGNHQKVLIFKQLRKWLVVAFLVRKQYKQ